MALLQLPIKVSKRPIISCLNLLFRKNRSKVWFQWQMVWNWGRTKTSFISSLPNTQPLPRGECPLDDCTSTQQLYHFKARTGRDTGPRCGVGLDEFQIHFYRSTGTQVRLVCHEKNVAWLCSKEMPCMVELTAGESLN